MKSIWNPCAGDFAPPFEFPSNGDTRRKLLVDSCKNRWTSEAASTAIRVEDKYTHRVNYSFSHKQCILCQRSQAYETIRE